MRTPYRYDSMQSTYFVTQSFDELFGILERGGIEQLFADAVAL
jgi:phenylalanine-4-hydroxylase